MDIRMKNLIKKNSEKWILKTQVSGSLNKGKWEEGQINYYEIDACITEPTKRDIEKYEGGKYSQHHKKLKVLEDLEGELLTKNEDGTFTHTDTFESVEIEEDDFIRQGEIYYRVDKKADRTRHSDFQEFIIKKKAVD